MTLSRNDRKVATLVSEVLERATSWVLPTTPRKFEGHEYYAIEAETHGAEDDKVCCVLRDRVTRAIQLAFERFSRPLVVV